MIKESKVNHFLFYFFLLSIFYILIYNIFHYSPILGYDAEAHYTYVDHISRYLPRSLNLPSPIDTREYFNPPLGYLVPALSQVVCRNIIESQNFIEDCRPIYGNVTQIFQSLIYLFTIYINLLTLKKINNSNNLINLSYLVMVSLLAVNYRTISMIRGEPYILFFLSIFLYFILKIEKQNFNFVFKEIFFLGLSIGGIALSRQWGFLLFLPLIYLLFTKHVKNKINYLKIWVPSAVIGFLISGWFYINLYFETGSFTAFNMNRNSFSIANQPINFYFPTIENIRYLFYKPIRPHLDNQFVTSLYADLWGDYWGYFTFTSGFLNIGRNQNFIGDYFARVNLISLVTTIIILVFYVLSYRDKKTTLFIKYINLAIISSFIGYVIFLILYPTGNGDTIKATYIIQMFHLVVFLASISLEKAKNSNLYLYNSIIFILLVIYMHNFETYLSHFPRAFFNQL